MNKKDTQMFNGCNLLPTTTRHNLLPGRVHFHDVLRSFVSGAVEAGLASYNDRLLEYIGSKENFEAKMLQLTKEVAEVC